MQESSEGQPSILDTKTTRRTVNKVLAASLVSAATGGAVGLIARATGAVDNMTARADIGNPNNVSEPSTPNPEATPEEEVMLPYESDYPVEYVFYGDVQMFKKDREGIPLNFRTSPDIKDNPNLETPNKVPVESIKELNGVNIEDTDTFIITNPVYVTVTDEQTGEIVAYIQIKGRVKDFGGRDDDKDLYVQVSELTDDNMRFTINEEYIKNGGDNNGLLYASIDEQGFMHASVHEGDRGKTPAFSSSILDIVSIPQVPEVPDSQNP